MNNMTKKTIKIKFSGFWQSFNTSDNFIIDILKKRYNVILCDDPDFVFVSVFEAYPYDYLDYDCVRIFYTGEPICADFTNFDYAIGFDELKLYDRYCNFPNPLAELYNKDMFKGKTRNEAEKLLNAKEFFCNYIYGHQSAEGGREAVLAKVQEYKRVEIAGRFMNNMPDGKVIPFNKEKLEFLNKCKFTLACESMIYPGFTTEKIVQAFEGNSVPIYYGNPDVSKIYNPKAFVNLMDFDNIDAALDKIREIDNNDELYLNMLMEPKLLDENYIDKKFEELEAFLYNIFDQDKENAYRRIRHYSAKYYSDFLTEMHTVRFSLPALWYLKLRNNTRIYSFFRNALTLFRKIFKK